MQRVAVELAGELALRNDLQYRQIVLRSAWKWHHIRCAPWLLATAARLSRIASRKEVDVILFSSMVTGALATLIRKACHSANIQLAAIAHGRDVTLPGIYQTLQVLRTLKALDRVLPVSRATGLECEKRGMPSSRIQIIPNGVTLSRYQVGIQARDRVRNLLSVGRLVKRKGFAWFVDQVMPELPSDIEYRIAGTGTESKAIQQAATVRGLKSRVHLLGRCSNEHLVELYRESDLLIMPNLAVEGDMEGFGVVMLEAGASGTPAISADLEGIRDVITDGVNGQLVRSGDASAFKDAILNYPTTSAARENAYQHTKATFSWSSVAERYVHHLQTLHSSTVTD